MYVVLGNNTRRDLDWMNVPEEDIRREVGVVLEQEDGIGPHAADSTSVGLHRRQDGKHGTDKLGPSYDEMKPQLIESFTYPRYGPRRPKRGCGCRRDLVRAGGAFGGSGLWVAAPGMAFIPFVGGKGWHDPCAIDVAACALGLNIGPAVGGWSGMTSSAMCFSQPRKRSRAGGSGSSFRRAGERSVGASSSA